MKVFALFQDETRLDAALEALQGTLHDSDDIEVIRPQESNDDPALGSGTVAVPVGPGHDMFNAAGAIQRRTGSPTTSEFQSILSSHGLGQQESDYFAQALGNGAQVLVVDTADADRVCAILERHDARIHMS